MNSQTTFTFKSHELDFLKREAVFKYSLSMQDQKIDFTEKVLFPPVQESNVNQNLVSRILDNLLLILGISYWKLYCPEKIILESVSLNKDQAEFWNTVYTKGLGEFFYRNKIDYRGLVRFPFSQNVILNAPPRSGKYPWGEVKDLDQKKRDSSSSPQNDNGGRFLLTVGGGKDSIVTGEYLKEQGKPFDILTIGDSSIQQEVSRLLDKTPIVIKRELDPKLFELNKNGKVYNGHIPISVIYAFLGLFAGALYDYKYVIVSNEKSADIGNVEYLGSMVNHQWSKSQEFEEMFKTYVAKYISPDLHYYSPLRNLTEIKIAQVFSKYNKYFSAFSSCNRNFKISRDESEILNQVQDDSGRVRDDNKKRWCGECPKCVFVFTLLSAFLNKAELDRIFGKDLYKEESLLPLFKELLGIKDFKPFECVGTPEEMALAMYKAYKSGEYKEDIIMKMFEKEILPENYDWESMEKELLGGEISFPVIASPQARQSPLVK